MKIFFYLFKITNSLYSCYELLFLTNLHPALVPILVAPAATTFSMSSIVRTPPDAFTSKHLQQFVHQETASGVAPPVEKPVDVLTNVA